MNSQQSFPKILHFLPCFCLYIFDYIVWHVMQEIVSWYTKNFDTWRTRNCRVDYRQIYYCSFFTNPLPWLYKSDLILSESWRKSTLTCSCFRSSVSWLVIWIWLCEWICRGNKFNLSLCYKVDILWFFWFLENFLVLAKVEFLEAVEHFLYAALCICVKIWHTFIQ